MPGGKVPGGVAHAPSRHATPQKFIGGCDQLKTLQYSGELTAMLGHDAVAADIEGAFGGVAQSAVATGTPPAPMTFFDFPAVADDRVIRLVGLTVRRGRARISLADGDHRRSDRTTYPPSPPPQVSIACILCAAFFDRVHAQWTMGGIMIDFSLRFYGGANISPIGSMAQLIAAVMERFGSKPRWVRAGWLVRVMSVQVGVRLPRLPAASRSPPSGGCWPRRFHALLWPAGGSQVRRSSLPPSAASCSPSSPSSASR